MYLGDKKIINGSEEFNIPENKIVAIPTRGYKYEDLEDILVPLSGKRKRSWFEKHSYNCLPLTIANQYGFVLKCPYTVSFLWDGGSEKSSISVKTFDDFKAFKNKTRVDFDSHFGNGIVTITVPVMLRTPPGINLLTIPPPNFWIPNISHLMGSIETDNLRYSFTFNFKIDFPDTETIISAGTPIAAFIPIPRYFADSFEMIHAKKIYSKEIIDKEIQAYHDKYMVRIMVDETENPLDKTYLSGTDIYSNKFKDHQR